MPKTKFICQHCGKEFERWASKYKDGIAKYCSLKCNGASQKNKETKNRKLIHCDNCDKEFLIYNNRYEAHKNHFCSYKCSDKFRENKVIKICEGCGKEFEVKKSISDLGYGRYCSSECRNEFMRKENSILYKSKKTVCPICNKEFYPKPSEVSYGKGKFCSKKCSYKSQMLERPQDSKHFYGTTFWIRLREECCKRDKYICQECGIKGDSRFHAHHVKPRTFKGEDLLENLITLCPSCHTTIEYETRKKLNIKLYKRA